MNIVPDGVQNFMGTGIVSLYDIFLPNDQVIADWWFEDFKNQPLSIDSFLDLVQMADKSLVILQKHELLFPQKVKFHTWFSTSINRTYLHNVENPELVLNFTDKAAGSLERLVKDNLEKFKVNGVFLFPRFDISGPGTIQDGTKIVQKEVVLLQGLKSDGNVIKILTFTDVWLPFSLTGEEQKGAGKNAQKLRSTLQEIEQALHLKPQFDSKYLAIDGYQVDNIKDVAGERIIFSKDLKVI